MTRRSVAGLTLTLWAAVSCAYYNGMWSANHYAGQARGAERAGQMDEARSAWAMAAVKAESVVSRHPHSRWAPAALVLQGEGLARSGACERAAEPLARALGTVTVPALRERAALAAATCAVARGDPIAAESLLAPVTGSADRRRASTARYLTGRAADLRGDPVLAATWYARSTDPEAGFARARVLLAQGRSEAAAGALGTLLRGRAAESDWAPLLDDVGRAAGAQAASAVLDRLLALRHVSIGSRARLLLADGDRLFAARALAAAGARYAQATAIAPDSIAGREARVRALRVAAAAARTVAELHSVRERLARLTATGLDGTAAGEAATLDGLLGRVLLADDAADALWFHAGELARDSLAAPELAAGVFLSLGRDRSASLFAPKALVAAAALLGDGRDSVLGVLQATYPASPYTLALRGEASPGYAAAEDSLAVALGVAVITPPLLGAHVAPPVPGPRGPPLDAPGLGRHEPDEAPARGAPRSPPRGDRSRGTKPIDRP